MEWRSAKSAVHARRPTLDFSSGYYFRPLTKQGDDMKDLLILTPALFRYLDVIARKHGGCVIEVKTPEQMKGSFVRWSMWAADVYKDHTMTSGDEVSAIQLVNTLTVKDFRSMSRPEIDYSSIPPELIFPYLLWLGLGFRSRHYDDFHMQIMPDIDRAIVDRVVREMRFLNQILADRFAWKHMFGDGPPPLSKQGKALQPELFNRFQQVNKYLPLYDRSQKNTLPNGPGEYVPHCHMKDGLPLFAAQGPKGTMAELAELSVFGMRQPLAVSQQSR